MHSRVISAFTFVFVFLPILSIASPLSSRTNGVVNGLDVRQLNIDEIIINIAEDIIEGILMFNSEAHAVERSFTQQMVDELGDRYPDKNRLVFHNPKSTFSDLSLDAVHAHYEVDIGLGFTQGYEIYVFDSGTFWLAGDGGYENYCYAGCWTRGPRTPAISTPSIIFTKPNATCL